MNIRKFQFEQIRERFKRNPWDAPVAKLLLPPGTTRALERAGLITLGEIAMMTETELCDLSRLGNKSIADIKKVLSEFGLALSPISQNIENRETVFLNIIKLHSLFDPELNTVKQMLEGVSNAKA